MNNVKNEQSEQALQIVPGVQQSVEEAYLNTLLSPVLINNGDDYPDLAESMHSNPVIMPEVERKATELHSMENEGNEYDLKEQAASTHIVNDVSENIQEAWPQVAFACQLISVAGLNLALPLSTYTHVIPWPGELQPAKDGEAYLAGHMQHGVCDFDIVDLTGLIMNRKVTDMVENSRHTHVILLQDGSTCLPCDGLLDIVTVDPDKVCWRSPDSKRIWLAGTVKDKSFALLDTERIMRLLGKY